MTLVNERAHILKNEYVGPKLYVMELMAPKIASMIEPGQFVHMKIPHAQAHVLRRPFSVYTQNTDMHTIEILYQTVGSGTECMARLRPDMGDDVELIGPIGHGWQPPVNAQRVLLVGGGVGAAPLYLLCERLVKTGVHTDVILGAQTKAALACYGRYKTISPASLHCATDDGTYERTGVCTSLVEEALEIANADRIYDYIAVCGPEPLMKAVSAMAKTAGIPCEVSLERRMACGVGACLSCVVDTVEGKKRSCVDGPVFNAKEVVW